MDLSKYTVKELQELKADIDKEIKRRRRDEQKKAQQELKQVADKYGFSLQELVGAPAQRKGGAAAKSKNRYRHPTDPNRGWSGRGRRPQWIKEWEESGRSREELRID